ncbi:MAG TPA: FG-GAP-like repeat-containing protein [Candidatus Eisenbacteria bacterium]
MRNDIGRRMAAILIPLLTLPSPLFAQAFTTFTRITDPANPIVTETGHQSGGGCWVDLVGDGYLDLFVANGNLSNELNSLYRNNRAGGFVRVTTGSVRNDGGSSIGGTVGDYDNDGKIDLFVTNRNFFGNFLYRGLGDTNFVKVTGAHPVTDLGNSNSASWVDVDRDGNLDLYVVNFQGADYFYRNGGAPAYAFTRVDTTALTAGGEFSIPGAWGDYNNDGRPDLFIGNAGTQSDYLYQNRGNLWFTRTSIADGGATLGASWGDFDNDGDLDLVVPHFQGQKIKFYRNSGAPLYQLASIDTGAVSASFGNWIGSGWGDCDNDGDLDLVVTYDGAPAGLFRNDGPPNHGFTRIVTGPVGTDTGYNFGAVWGDYDRDGQLDLFIANRLGEQNRLYHNDGNANHWLTIRAVGTVSNRSAIGARIRLHSKVAGVPRSQMREVTGQTGYNSQNLDQHFGLADAAVADSIVIDWPSGAREVWRGVLADRWMTLIEGGSTVAVPERPQPVSGGVLFAPPRPNPARGAVRLSFRLAVPGDVTLALFDVRGRRMRSLLAERRPAGSNEISWRPDESIPDGVYFVRLEAGVESRTERLVIAR